MSLTIRQNSRRLPGRDPADRLATQCRHEFGSATVRRIWGD